MPVHVRWVYVSVCVNAWCVYQSVWASGGDFSLDLSFHLYIVLDSDILARKEGFNLLNYLCTPESCLANIQHKEVDI